MCKHERLTTVNIFEILLGNVGEYWGMLGNYGGPYYGGFSKSIQAFSKIPLDFPLMKVT